MAITGTNWEELLYGNNVGADRSGGYSGGTSWGAAGSNIGANTGFVSPIQGLKSYNLSGTSLGQYSDPTRVAKSFNLKDDPDDKASWLDNDTMTAGGSLLKGFGSVLQALMAYKNYGLAKDMLAQKTDEFNINLANSTKLTNDQIRDLNAWKDAQNMGKQKSDLLPNYRLPAS